jgi:hypothetical protein
MRKILFSNIATENMNSAVTTGLISLEEEQILLNEASDLGNAVSNDLAEVDRLAETSDVLDDLAVIADSIEKATPAETDLIDAVGSMAVTGTDIPSEEVVPAMESFVGKKIATESFSAKAKTIWENIQKFLKKIWDNITLFFKKMFATLPNTKKRLAELQEKTKSLSGKNNESSITISAGTSFMCQHKRAPKDSKEYLRFFTSLIGVNETVFFGQAKTIEEIGKVIATGIDGFKPNNPGSSVLDFITNFEKAAEKLKLPVTPFTFIGNGTLESSNPTDTDDGKDILHTLSLGLKYGITFSTSKESAPDSIEIKSLTETEIHSVIKYAQDALEKIEQFETNYSKKLEEIGTSIKKASDKAAAAFKTSEPTKESEALFRAVLNYNQVYAKLVSGCNTKLISHNFSCINVMMMVVNKSLAGYK